MTIPVRHALRRACLVAALASSVACAGNARLTVPPGTRQPDQFLFDKGADALARHKWLTAREYYKQVTETYTQSPLRPDAKLAIGDSYLGEGSTESLILGIAEFEEFLSFYPTHPKADYAQFQLALCHFKQMRSPQRDQTETRDTIREFERFLARYPSSALRPDAMRHLREAKDRLGDSEMAVGIFYWRIHWYVGAIDRLSTLVKTDPEFTLRDSAYFYLGESLMAAGRPAEALVVYEKLLSEFTQSTFLPQTQKRVAEVKATMAAKGAPASS